MRFEKIDFLVLYFFDKTPIDLNKHFPTLKSYEWYEIISSYSNIIYHTYSIIVIITLINSAFSSFSFLSESPRLYISAMVVAKST